MIKKQEDCELMEFSNQPGLRVSVGASRAARSFSLMQAVSRCERGFGLISAIFLLVVIAALGAFAVTLSTTQQQSAALDILGSRAYQAANAGIEWGAYQVLPATSTVFAATCLNSGSASQVISPLAGTLAGFTVAVSCAGTSAVEKTQTVLIYQLSASATQGALNSSDYVERSVASQVWFFQ